MYIVHTYMLCPSLISDHSHEIFKFGNWDGGTALEKVVEAASELRVPGLLQVD